MLNESLAPRDILSEGLKHHLDAKKPLTEHLYRAGSTNYFNLWAEARSMYSRGILEITHEDDLAVLTETNLGHYGMFEGKKVPLDFPIELNESYDYDEVAQSEFGMDYDQLGDNEKEWVRDEIDNMSMNEYSSEGEGWDDDEIEIERDGNIISVKTSIGDEVRYKGHKGKVVKTEYDGVRVNFPSIGENGLTMHFYYEDLNSKEGYYQAVDESLNEANSNYPDFDLDKNVRYQDTVITSGMWRYTDKESGGKGVYRNLMNDQFLGFSSEDLGYFKKHLGSHFDMSESLSEAKKDIYDRFLDNPENPRGRAKIIIDKFIKEYGVDASQMAVDVFSNRNNLKPEEKYILKYITKDDVQISSQPGGPDFSALMEDKKGKKKLNKPTRDSSGGKAYKVYVKDPKTGNIKTVRFGSGGLRAKINDKKARNAFAARHKCSTKKDKTKAGYWSCRLPRYAKLLGLKSNFGGFW
ncbi:hypothetical protein N9864_00290 [bacterium]|nr:hypothetical protein [bacterium]